MNIRELLECAEFSLTPLWIHYLIWILNFITVPCWIVGIIFVFCVITPNDKKVFFPVFISQFVFFFQFLNSLVVLQRHCFLPLSFRFLNDIGSLLIIIDFNFWVIWNRLFSISSIGLWSWVHGINITSIYEKKWIFNISPNIYWHVSFTSSSCLPISLF